MVPGNEDDVIPVFFVFFYFCFVLFFVFVFWGFFFLLISKISLEIRFSELNVVRTQSLVVLKA